MNSKTPSWLEKPVPEALEGLRRVAISTSKASTREQSEAPDVFYGVRSFGDLQAALDRDSQPPSKTPRGSRTAKR